MNVKHHLFSILRAPSDAGMGGGEPEVVSPVVDDEEAMIASFFNDDAPVEAEADEPEAEEIEEAAGPDEELTPEEIAAQAEQDAADAAEAEEKAAIEAAKKDPEQEVEEVFTVKIDGVESEVTESELVAGYQRQSDYTKKTQAHAETVRAFEQESTAQLAELKNALAYYALPTAKEPLPQDFAGKPEEFMNAYGQWQKQSQSQAEAESILEQITASEKADLMRRETELLQSAIPEWADDTVRQSDFTKMVEEGSKRYGFTPDEIAQVTDHRLLMLLRDAARVGEFEAKPVILQRKTSIKPKLSAGTTTKANPKAEANAKAIKKLNNGGNPTDDDIVNMIFQ